LRARLVLRRVGWRGAPERRVDPVEEIIDGTGAIQ
jgi:hypothetical protein